MAQHYCAAEEGEDSHCSGAQRRLCPGVVSAAGLVEGALVAAGGVPGKSVKSQLKELLCEDRGPS